MPAAGTQAPLTIGYALSLTGALGASGRSAWLAHRIWEEGVDRRGGLLGRRVQMVAYDDRSNAAPVSGIYRQLLDVDKVDLIVGGYGDRHRHRRDRQRSNPDDPCVRGPAGMSSLVRSHIASQRSAANEAV